MFYVCYVVGARVNAVFPANWLKGPRMLLEKYINTSLNHNQQLLAYYSEEQWNRIANGQSAIVFRPDFQLNKNVQFPATGCYDVLPKKKILALMKPNHLLKIIEMFRHRFTMKGVHFKLRFQIFYKILTMTVILSILKN